MWSQDEMGVMRSMAKKVSGLKWLWWFGFEQELTHVGLFYGAVGRQAGSMSFRRVRNALMRICPFNSI